jgi:hypothetical protein
MKETLLVLDRRRAKEFSKLDPRLIEMVDLALAHWPVSRCYVSSIYRTEAEEKAAGGKSGIHCIRNPHRAIDLSAYNINGKVEDKWRACGRVGSEINRVWAYDPKRPEKAVAVSEKHGTGPHLHLQCHTRTGKKE